MKKKAVLQLLPLLSLSAGAEWVLPGGGLPAGHNGGFSEQLVEPAAGAGRQPHVLFVLFDDYGWADAGWHRNYTIGGTEVPYTDEVQTPTLNELVRSGINLDRSYVYKYCSPTRSAIQSGRNPYHVNNLNLAPDVSNRADPVSGFAAIPRNMTGIATKMAAAGYRTGMFGKWDAGMATPDHTPMGRGYQTAMHYFHHANDYWAMTTGECRAADPEPAPGPKKQCTAGKFENYCAGLSPNVNRSMTWVDAPEDCCSECSSDPRCTAWVFGHSKDPHSDKHSCFLKTELLKKEPGNCTASCMHEGGCLAKSTPVVDLWLAGSGKQGPAHGFNNTCVGFNPDGARPDDCHAGPNGDKWYDGYEDALFEQHVLDFITEQDPKQPMFLFWAPHIVHAPLQAPEEFIDKFSFIAPTDKPKHQRQNYHAMVNFADTAVKNVTDALKAKGMWDDLLIVFSTDNGGPIYANGTGGANNYPLKGGKMNNWEGGIRGNSFISGGFLAESQRGTTYDGLITVWDHYATFAALAGVDATDHRAAAAGLPPIDGVDHSGLILGTNTTSPRTEVPIGTEPRASNVSGAPLCSSYGRVERFYYDDYCEMPDYLSLGSADDSHCTTLSGVIVDYGEEGFFKILTGDVQQDCFTGPHYPNISTDEVSANFVGHCADGCLFNLTADPFERHDLAGDAAFADKLKELQSKVVAYEKTAFNPHRGKTDPAACEHVRNDYGGFWGPFIDA